MRKIVYQHIKSILKRDFVLESPRDRNLAHFATPLAFTLAKELKQSPHLIAQDLLLCFAEDSFFDKVECVNAYINFKLSPKFLNTLCTQALSNPSSFCKGEQKEQSIFLEYVSANPTGPLHIGHARGAVYGNTLYNLAKHLGYKIHSEYYVNDSGKQISLLGLSVLSRVKQLLGHDVEISDDCYKGDYIIELANEALLKFDKSFFVDENLDELALWAKDKMLDNIKNTLADAKIYIDNYMSERAIYKELDETLELLKQKGGAYEKDGKLFLASSLRGDEKDRVILREDKSATYLATDIAYHRHKMSSKYDVFINIWGADHHGYIARVKAAMNFLGFDDDKLEIILAQMVSLLKANKPYKMSKRAGNFILMQDVLDEIGSDALRFIFISKKCDTHLEFDVDEFKKEDSTNPVFYINYAYARIHQVFAKAQKETKDVINADISSLNEEALNLLFEALNLEAVLNDAFESRALQKISDYLKMLAGRFHKFYNENKVLGAENEDALLKLFAAVALSIKTALAIIGISAKDKM